MKKIVLGIMLLMGSLTFAQGGYEGYWMMPKGKFIIHIKKTESSEYTGHVVWLKDLYYPEGDKMEGLEQYDRNNPNKSLREENRKVIGLLVVGELFEKNPSEILRKAVYNMLPKNKLRKEMIKRLTVK